MVLFDTGFCVSICHLLFTRHDVLGWQFCRGGGGEMKGFCLVEKLICNNYIICTCIQVHNYLLLCRSGLEVTLLRVLISWLVKSMGKFMKTVSCFFLSFLNIYIF